MQIRNESGSSIIELLISTLLLGVVLFNAQSFLIGSQKSILVNQDRLEKLDISRQIVRRIDCERLNTNICPNGRKLTLRGFDNEVLVSRRGSKIGKWDVQAQCGPNGKLEIRTAQKQGRRGFKQDPVTKALLDFQHPNALLFPEGSLCAVPSSARQASEIADLKLGQTCIVNTARLLPCNPSPPPPCSDGFLSVGTSLDTFGGDDDPNRTNVFGQRYIRYCQRM